MNQKRTVGGLLWKFAERCSYQVISFVITIILARLLSPDEYGTIAIVAALIAILQVFVDSGMGTALVQKKEITNVDYSTVFITNVSASVLIYILVFLISPVISNLYQEDLTDIIRVLSLVIVIFSVKNVFMSYIIKNMLFKKAFFTSLIGIILGGTTGIMLALYGFGIWALVFQQLISEFVATILLVTIVKWKPHCTFSLTSLKNTFSFSWKLLVSSLIDTIYNNIRQLLIGKYYTSEDLAYYSKGDQFPNLIVSNINSTLNTVLLPVLSERQDNVAYVKSSARRIIQVGSFILWPMMIGLFVTSGNIIELLLTSKWNFAVPYMQIFCILYAMQPLQTTNLSVMKALGRTDLCLKLEIIKKTLAFVIILITLTSGPLVMAIGSLVYAVLATIINSYPNKKLINYSYLEQLKDITPFIILASLMGGTVYLVGLINLHVLPKLAIQVIVGITVYFALAKVFKIKSFDYCLDIAKSFLGRKI